MSLHFELPPRKKARFRGSKPAVGALFTWMCCRCRKRQSATAGRKRSKNTKGWVCATCAGHEGVCPE